MREEKKLLGISRRELLTFETFAEELKLDPKFQVDYVEIFAVVVTKYIFQAQKILPNDSHPVLDQTAILASPFS